MANRRTKSISTKVTEAEYEAIVTRADPQTVSAWAREILVGAVQPEPLLFLLLAEVLALRTIIVNLNFGIATDGPPSVEAMHSLIERADQNKLNKAAERIERLVPAIDSTRR
jgi:hypothetical protein